MDLDEEKLRHLLNEDVDGVNENQSLEKVLSDGKKVVAVKDVASLFVGWVWVVFLGFGASLYSAKRQYEKHVSAKKKPLRIKDETNLDKEN